MKKFTDFEKELIDVCIGWIGEEPVYESYIHTCSKKLLQLISSSPSLWAARDKNGSLWLYREKPVLKDNEFLPDESINEPLFSIDDRLFPEVSFENSPKQVKFLLCEP